MLAKANRVISGADFRGIVRNGRRMASPLAVIYSLHTGDAPTRFGFIISKNVGGAVVRNRMRRQLRALGRDLLVDTGRGLDVVVRPLSGSAEQPWTILQSQVIDAVHHSVHKYELMHHGDVRTGGR